MSKVIDDASFPSITRPAGETPIAPSVGRTAIDTVISRDQLERAQNRRRWCQLVAMLQLTPSADDLDATVERVRDEVLK